MIPRITILLPTYNRSTMLIRAIESCLAQSLQEIEIVVGNNASTDNTIESLHKYHGNPRIRVVNRAENIGATGNINDLLLRHSRSKYVLVMSDDDYFVDYEYLKDAYQRLESDETLGFIHGEIEYEVEDGIVHANSQRCLPPKQEGRDFFINFGNKNYDYVYLMTALVRRNLAVEINLYGDPRIPHGDSLAWLLISSRFDVGFINRVVARYVMHGNNAIRSPDISIWLDDIYFINTAYRHAIERTDWSRELLKQWLFVQRRRYCGKVIRMLHGDASWRSFFRHLRILQVRHRFIEDEELVLLVYRALIKRAFGKP